MFYSEASKEWYICTLCMHHSSTSEESKAQNVTELFANITKIIGYKRLTGIFHNHGFYIYSQKRNHNQAQKYIFSISVITETLRQLHWACRTFGNLSKSLRKQKIKKKTHAVFIICYRILFAIFQDQILLF